MQEFTDPERVEVEAGKPFVVLLSRNFEGPYLWTAVEVPEGVLMRAEENVAASADAPGAAGTKRFELEAVGPGTFTLRFERRFEQGQPQVAGERSVVVEAR
jgi:predicted secreted protein